MTVDKLPLKKKFEFICAMMQCVNEWRRNHGHCDDEWYNEAHGMKEALALLYGGDKVHMRFCDFFVEFGKMVDRGNPRLYDNDDLRDYLICAFGIPKDEFQKKYKFFEKEKEERK